MKIFWLFLAHNLLCFSGAVPPVRSHGQQQQINTHSRNASHHLDVFQTFNKFLGDLTKRKCSSECNIISKSVFSSVDDTNSPITRFVEQVQQMKHKMALVSVPRKTVTGLLTKAALLDCNAGDIAETGVFAGGSSAVIMKVLLELDQCNRKFYVFDSFQGLPETVKEDRVNETDTTKINSAPGSFAVTQEFFTTNLRSMNVWSNSVIVIAKGWFKDTIPVSPVQKIAFLRLDGDLYVSTRDAIEGLYPKVIKGGYIYVDDYGSFPGCKAAIDEYRSKHSITDEMHNIYEDDGNVEAVWWKKT